MSIANEDLMATEGQERRKRRGKPSASISFKEAGRKPSKVRKNAETSGLENNEHVDLVRSFTERRASNHTDDDEEDPEMLEDLVNGEDLDDEQNMLKACFDKKVRPYIDLVDELRRHGLEKDIDLPSIVVIGDQSSGKSSILEAISGIQLPRGSGIVTRCPLAMQLKKTMDPSAHWRARLLYETAGHQRRDISVEDPETLEGLIRKAQDEIAGERKGISPKLITLNVVSPTCPDLTLIDLPGIARTAVEDQPKDICEQIRSLLRDQIEKTHTIMLCVIPSNVDIAVNEALSLAQEFDPEGVRTLGVLTKPDLVDEGTEHEIIAILNNEKFHLKNGYSIVRCRGQREIDAKVTLEEALKEEENFFKRHRQFRDVPVEQRGTRQLSIKLTEKLVEHIQRTLPVLREEVHYKLEQAQRKLLEMSHGPPNEESGKRAYLMELTGKVLEAVEKVIIKGDVVPGYVIFKYMKEMKPADALHDINTSWQWRKRFEGFKMSMESFTDNAFKREALTIPNLEKRLNYYRGRELPHFINFELFETLVKGHVSRYLELANECFENMSKDLLAVVEYVCQEKLQHVPAVLGTVRGIAEDCRTECREKGKELMDLELEKENLVYTQDQTYITELKRLEAKQREEAEKNPSNRRNQRRLMSFSLSTNEDEEESSSQNNATVMQQLLKMYLKVANRRIQDNVPLLIRTTQHIRFYFRLKDRLRQLVAGEGIEKMVEEDPKIAMERKQLQDKTARLSEAMKLLNYT